MARYNYVEKAITVTRREFLAMAGILSAMLWTGVYVATDLVEDRNKYIKLRSAGLYRDDLNSKKRQSHENAGLQDMYDKLAERPLSEVAEELFHTKYVDRTKIG
jgi:ferredoxin hydrogenase small subunit